MNNLDFILSHPLVLLFLILTLGSLLGKLRLAGVTLSASGGVLFIALAFGHFGYSLPDNVGAFGFAFFIYAIGFGAGPRFFQTFLKNGLQYGFVALFVACIATVVGVLCANVFHFPILLLPGILAGALTSTSTMAAAYEITNDPTISVGYGITYPFGLIGLLLLIQFLPKLLKIDLKAEAKAIKIAELDEEEDKSFQQRVFQVQNPGVVGIPLKDLNLRKLAGVGIVTIKRGENIEFANADSKLQLYDHILAEGKLVKLLELEDYLGPEIADDFVEEQSSTTERVVINRKQVVNKSARELQIARNMGVIMTRLQRGGIDLPVDPDFKLERGDIITIAGSSSGIKETISFLGRREHKIFETDMLTFNAGLLMGILLGMIKWPIINASLGSAGGLLFMGILLGYLRNFGPFSGRVPVAARYLMQELGLLLFLAGIGTKAGQGLVEHVLDSGVAIFTTGALITVITLLSTLFMCHYVLKFDWNTSLGATTGGVTSTVALKVVTNESESQYAVLGYAGVYAFANILLTLLGQIIVRFM